MIDSKNVNFPKLVLRKFAVDGYKKTSMKEVAEIIGVSRQAIYNRFKSKDICYQWAINSYLSEMYLNIFKILNTQCENPMKTLTDVFELLIVEAVDLVKHEYGRKVFDDALISNAKSDEDWTIRLITRLGTFLYGHGFTSSENDGSKKAFVLIAAGKGLLLESTSKQKSREDIQTILYCILKQADTHK